MRTPWCLIAPALLAGCASNSPQISREPFEGPQVTLDSSAARHTIVLTAPSSGWTLTFDRSRRQFETTEVFITITRPNPVYMRAQAQVIQNLDSNVTSHDPVVIYARTRDFGRAPKQAPYHLAVSSGVPPSKPP